VGGFDQTKTHTDPDTCSTDTGPLAFPVPFRFAVASLTFREPATKSQPFRFACCKCDAGGFRFSCTGAITFPVGATVANVIYCGGCLSDGLPS